MGVVTYIPKCILETEDIVTLKDMGVQLEEGHINIGSCKVNCIKVYNLTETQIFDKLDQHSLVESLSSDANSFVQRSITIIFMKIRQVAALKDKDQRMLGTCSLLAAVNALGAVDPKSANRFLPLIRGIY